MIFYNNFSSVIFTYHCLILQYLHDFELKQRRKNLENFSKITVFIKIFSFRFFTFHVITWLNFDLNPNIFPKISLNNPLKVSHRHAYGNPSRLGDIKLAKISGAGVKLPPGVFTLIKRKGAIDDILR